ncbi:amino acid permease [Streptomyces caniscabiei]|uniref:APC family permease n=1 Tax=Streptomyces caniscabiei TaxID=2746961 RepID=UPI0029AF07A4|nr:amino acid permease [Streptomyces caniscabiei]MDX2602365.1 amino acid permease [Streptomyces caniscabiei]MDX2734221.1 amino acid permease [Streptomyces caniscabiei]MDX2779739.1 amino acid permease [Streptomyces caniscabiei]
MSATDNEAHTAPRSTPVGPSDGVGSPASSAADAEMLAVLGYEQKFDRKVSLWANFALGFVYLSPLVGVVALFAVGLATGGGPSVFWIGIVGAGQFLVALVFGEVVSQFPLAGGLYQWVRRLWNGRYAWFNAWTYICCITIGITSTALFSSDFVASLFAGTADEPGVSSTPAQRLWIAIAVTVVCLICNCFGTRTLALISKIGLAAELIGIVLVGLYLLIFERHNSVSIFLQTSSSTHDSYVMAFIAASLVGLFLFYGFEACGEIAEEVPNPSRSIPRAMQLTVAVGGVAALLAFVGYALAAPDLSSILSGEDTNPIPSILQSSLGIVGTKTVLAVIITSFVAGVMSQQAAASRIVFSFARDDMFPGSRVFSQITRKHRVPMNALLAVNVLPLVIFVFVYYSPDSLTKIVAFQMLAGYAAFMMVVLAALRMRLKGWRPAGAWTLGRWGLVVNVAALAYGLLGMVLLAWPTGDSATPFVDRWIALIGFLVVSAVGLVYLWTAKPERKSTAPEGDAMEVAERLRSRAAALESTTGGNPA